MNTLLFFFLLTDPPAKAVEPVKPTITAEEQIKFLQLSNEELQAQVVALQKTIARVTGNNELLDAWKSRGCRVSFDEKSKLLYCADAPKTTEVKK